MTRKTLLLVVLLSLATSMFARQRAVSSGGGHLDAKVDGATVSGIVTSVSGNLIQLADNLVTIDAANAKIVVDRGKDTTIADIEPGMLVFAVLSTHQVASNAPLPAAMITATRLPEATLFGPVHTVDASAGTFTLLGRTIHVTNETSFGGFRGSHPGLADLLPNQIVQVQAEAENGKLIADSVLIISPIPTNTHVTHGKVKSIAGDSWVITREKDGGDLTLVVNAQTKIAGSPKVGDDVEVLYAINSANQAVAIAIVKFERPDPPINDTLLFRATVKKIGQTEWSVTLSDGKDQVLVINERTKIMPGIKTGDRVEVLAQKRKDGSVLALAILKFL
ncbi:MAG TPA: DUF5666 domain-containing protein [Thermoanaerobaculia bacterium]|nr:DUF5666 domain-containing protein [Thermoanaerobaculia bacterium]